jgi:ethanolamine utilization protein EutN
MQGYAGGQCDCRDRRYRIDGLGNTDERRTQRQKAKGKRQKAKGQITPPLLPFAFCILPFAFVFFFLPYRPMFLAKVQGRVWCTAKNETLDGKKMLVLQPVDASLKPRGKQFVALDAVGAGAGELVYCCRGKEASFPWLPDETPIEVTVIGIVDQVDTL